MTAARRSHGHLTLIVSTPADDAAGGLVAGAPGPAFPAPVALETVGADPSTLRAASALPAPTAPAATDTGDLGADTVALVRLVGGAPVATPGCNLITFANRAWAGLDPARDPNGYTLAEVALAWFHTHVGVERRTEGERAGDLASDFQRYLLPYALEFDAAQPHAGSAGYACSTPSSS